MISIDQKQFEEFKRRAKQIADLSRTIMDAVPENSMSNEDVMFALAQVLHIGCGFGTADAELVIQKFRHAYLKLDTEVRKRIYAANDR